MEEDSASDAFDSDITGGGLESSGQTKGQLATVATLRFFLELKSVFNGALRHKIRCQECVLGPGMGVGGLNRASFIAPEAPLFPAASPDILSPGT